MLAVSAFLLAVGAFAAFSEPFFHRREGASEFGHLRSDVGDVLFGGHACRSLRREPRVSTRPSASSRLAKNGSPRDTASAMPATRRSGWRRRAATEPAPGRGYTRHVPWVNANRLAHRRGETLNQGGRSPLEEGASLPVAPLPPEPEEERLPTNPHQSAAAIAPVLEVAVSADHYDQFHSAVVHFCGSEDNARGSNLKATRPQSRCEI